LQGLQEELHTFFLFLPNGEKNSIKNLTKQFSKLDSEGRGEHKILRGEGSGGKVQKSVGEMGQGLAG
jgi:hypothetical protein